MYTGELKVAQLERKCDWLDLVESPLAVIGSAVGELKFYSHAGGQTRAQAKQILNSH